MAGFVNKMSPRRARRVQQRLGDGGWFGVGVLHQTKNKGRTTGPAFHTRAREQSATRTIKEYRMPDFPPVTSTGYKRYAGVYTYQTQNCRESQRLCGWNLLFSAGLAGGFFSGLG